MKEYLDSSLLLTAAITSPIRLTTKLSKRAKIEKQIKKHRSPNKRTITDFDKSRQRVGTLPWSNQRAILHAAWQEAAQRLFPKEHSTPVPLRWKQWTFTWRKASLKFLTDQSPASPVDNPLREGWTVAMRALIYATVKPISPLPAKAPSTDKAQRHFVANVRCSQIWLERRYSGTA